MTSMLSRALPLPPVSRLSFDSSLESVAVARVAVANESHTRTRQLFLHWHLAGSRMSHSPCTTTVHQLVHRCCTAPPPFVQAVVGAPCLVSQVGSWGFDSLRANPRWTSSAAGIGIWWWEVEVRSADEDSIQI